ncbi:monomeric sarcosine oxidase [Nephila pilipes]|uniref:Monomeric sarcosine oxidase n=1 Tax=Nephila pilipes TaxID=299642 RepID=A0A8X6NTP0_NEPPI|nr:monomeric sarcosine oxidase [Nephila pilipes]
MSASIFLNLDVVSMKTVTNERGKRKNKNLKMSETIYDLCVIGGGMFGSSAARYASANVALKVCLIGPNEPTPEEFVTREIFGAHYDEARITRVLDDTPACQVLSKNSIESYKELKKLSGIDFHSPVGCIFMGPKDGAFMLKYLENSAIHNVPVVDLSDRETFEKRFPFLKLNYNECVLLDDNGGGHISPRKFVSAQKKVAYMQGCDIIDSVVCSAEILKDGIHEVRTESKGIIKAKRLLIATGAFANLKEFDVLKPLVLKRCKTTAVMLKITENEALRLSSMPAVIKRGCKTDLGAYILPPVKYPDGNYYMKIGGSFDYETGEELKTLDDLRKWYLSDGDERMTDILVNFINELIPGLKFTDLSRMTCVTCCTPSGLPYVDRVSPTVTVAVSGNGKGAKFSDEIGKIAAHLSITGQWNSELPRNMFHAIFQKNH